jgi:hypothetical protein
MGDHDGAPEMRIYPDGRLEGTMNEPDEVEPVIQCGPGGRDTPDEIADELVRIADALRGGDYSSGWAGLVAVALRQIADRVGATGYDEMAEGSPPPSASG